MIIVYPKYFEMPIIMDDDFENFTEEIFMYRGEEIYVDNIKEKIMQEDEFDEIDKEYINSQMQNRGYYF